MKKEKKMLIPKGCPKDSLRRIPTRVVSVLLLWAACIGQGHAQGGSYADSPFATNDFGIPSNVAKVIGITTKEQMEREIKIKLPYFKELGIKLARLHPNIFGTFGWSGVDSDHDGKNLDFSKQDALAKLAQKNNIDLLVGISPLPTDDEWLNADTYIPVDKNAYSSYIKQLVERYDGDGKDDMPGLVSPIKYWQLENEPDLHNEFRKQRGNVTFSSPEEYFEVLTLTYQAVKEADPQAKLLLNVVGFGQNMGDTSFNYLQKLNELGAENYYDIFSYHVYPTTYETSLLTELLQKFKRMTGDKPVWITESGVNGKLGEESEKEQATWIVKHYVSNIAGGVRKIVWLTIPDMSPSVSEGKVAKYSGLVTFNSAKKLSYHTYKKMVEVLEGSDWKTIATVQEQDGIYIYKFTKQGSPVWVAWNDSSVTRTVTISGITINRVKATEAVPKYESGKDVADYTTAFRTDTLIVTNGAAALTLGQRPVFVEPLTVTSVEEEDENIPKEFLLSQNYPNPFNPTTRISYQLPVRGDVTLEIFNLLGQKIKTLVSKNQAAGSYSILWDGKKDFGENVNSGVYFYQFNVDDKFSQTKKLLFLK
jgi:hypothetical protein